MFHKRYIGVLLTGALLAAVPVLGQEDFHRSEVSVQGLGSFVRDSSKRGVDQDATNSGGVLGTYRYLFDKHNGVEVDYGYTLNTQRYYFSSGALGLKSYSHEVTAAYVRRFPFQRWTAFALAGAGGIVFSPKENPGLDNQGRAAFVYGAGADFNLTSRIFLRAEYRGQLYKSPTYNVHALDTYDRVTHRAEPSVGIGYRF